MGGNVHNKLPTGFMAINIRPGEKYKRNKGKVTLEV
jgi:hypothetical protein